EGMVLVGAEVARAADGRQDALAVRSVRKLAQDWRRQVGAARLRGPPAGLHDDRHRRRSRPGGILVLEGAVDQAPLDLAVVLEEGLVAPLDDLALGERRDFAVARPLQRLTVKREALRVNGAHVIDPA